MVEECNHLDELKKVYQEHCEKYDLPDFDSLNRVFDVEEVDSETDYLLRRIRRVILDRIVGYVRFIEMMLNPSNAPMFFFKLVNKLEKSDKEILTEIYERLGKFELEAIKIDLEYSEEKEVILITKLLDNFQDGIRESLLGIISKLEKEKKEEKKKEDSEGYFG